MRQLRELEAEHAKLKRMYADLALEHAAIKDVLHRKLSGRPRSDRRCCIKTLRGGALLVTLGRSHTTGMKSKVHPTYKTKYRVANWPGL